MNLLCKAGKHKWEHCRCVRCRQNRDEEHLWKGCTCEVCGKVRNEEHDFVFVPGSYRETRQERYGPYTVYHDYHLFRCSGCGKSRMDPHQWTGTGCKTVCSVCGCTGRDLAGLLSESFEDKRNKRRIDVSHRWTGTTCRDTCKVCGESYFRAEHQWTGNTCVDTCKVCGIRNYKGKHSFIEIANEYEKGPGKTYRTFLAYRCELCGHEEKTYTEHDN